MLRWPGNQKSKLALATATGRTLVPRLISWGSCIVGFSSCWDTFWVSSADHGSEGSCMETPGFSALPFATSGPWGPLIMLLTLRQASQRLILEAEIAFLGDALGAQGSQPVSSVQSLSCVRLSATPWTAARQASLSITSSWSHGTI